MLLSERRNTTGVADLSKKSICTRQIRGVCKKKNKNKKKERKNEKKKKKEFWKYPDRSHDSRTREKSEPDVILALQ